MRMVSIPANVARVTGGKKIKPGAMLVLKVNVDKKGKRLVDKGTVCEVLKSKSGTLTCESPDGSKFTIKNTTDNIKVV